MSKTKTDVSKVEFSSTVYPSEDDMKLWDTLSPEEQRAVVIRDLDAAEASGVVEGDVTKDALIKTALDTLGHAS